ADRGRPATHQEHGPHLVDDGGQPLVLGPESADLLAGHQLTGGSDRDRVVDGQDTQPHRLHRTKNEPVQLAPDLCPVYLGWGGSGHAAVLLGGWAVDCWATDWMRGRRIAAASSGGTASPTWRYCADLVPCHG